jgi:hypothetical protein
LPDAVEGSERLVVSLLIFVIELARLERESAHPLSDLVARALQLMKCPDAKFSIAPTFHCAHLLASGREAFLARLESLFKLAAFKNVSAYWIRRIVSRIVRLCRCVVRGLGARLSQYALGWCSHAGELRSRKRSRY